MSRPLDFSLRGLYLYLMRINYPAECMGHPNESDWEIFKEDFSTFTYHFRRLLKEIFKDVKRGMRKPESGKRYIADMTEHQASYYQELKRR